MASQDLSELRQSPQKENLVHGRTRAPARQEVALSDSSSDIELLRVVKAKAGPSSEPAGATSKRSDDDEAHGSQSQRKKSAPSATTSRPTRLAAKNRTYRYEASSDNDDEPLSPAKNATQEKRRFTKFRRASSNDSSSDGSEAPIARRTNKKRKPPSSDSEGEAPPAVKSRRSHSAKARTSEAGPSTAGSSKKAAPKKSARKGRAADDDGDDDDYKDDGDDNDDDVEIEVSDDDDAFDESGSGDTGEQRKKRAKKPETAQSKAEDYITEISKLIGDEPIRIVLQDQVKSLYAARAPLQANGEAWEAISLDAVNPPQTADALFNTICNFAEAQATGRGDGKFGAMFKSRRAEIIAHIRESGTPHLDRIVQAQLAKQPLVLTDDEIKSDMTSEDTEYVLGCLYGRFGVGSGDGLMSREDFLRAVKDDPALRRVNTVYGGRSVNGSMRALQHFNEIESSEGSSRKVVEERKNAINVQLCLVDLTHARFNRNLMTEKDISAYMELMCGIECVICLLLGSFHGTLEYEQARAESGLCHLPGVVGVNGTPCMELIFSLSTFNHEDGLLALNPSLLRLAKRLTVQVMKRMAQDKAVIELQGPEKVLAQAKLNELEAKVRELSSQYQQEKSRMLLSGEYNAVFNDRGKDGYNAAGLNKSFGNDLVGNMLSKGFARKQASGKIFARLLLIDAGTRPTKYDVYHRIAPYLLAVLGGMQLFAIKDDFATTEEKFVLQSPRAHILASPGELHASMKLFMSMVPTYETRMANLRAQGHLYKTGEKDLLANDARLLAGEAHLGFDKLTDTARLTSCDLKACKHLEFPSFAVSNPEINPENDIWLRVRIAEDAHEIGGIMMHGLPDPETKLVWQACPTLYEICETDKLNGNIVRPWAPVMSDMTLYKQKSALSYASRIVQKLEIPLLDVPLPEAAVDPSHMDLDLEGGDLPICSSTEYKLIGNKGKGERWVGQVMLTARAHGIPGFIRRRNGVPLGHDGFKSYGPHPGIRIPREELNHAGIKDGDYVVVKHNALSVASADDIEVFWQPKGGSQYCYKADLREDCRAYLSEFATFVRNFRANPPAPIRANPEPGNQRRERRLRAQARGS